MSSDFIFINGEVITVDEKFTVTEGLAIKGNKIKLVGSNEEVLALKGDNTKVIDLKGRSLLPGFIDSHAHLELYGTNCLGVDCKNVQSIADIKENLKEEARRVNKGAWIRGWGYNQNHLIEGRHLTRWDLDEVSREHPIIVVRTCGHISCVNSKALEIAGITENTEDPSGGRYVKKDGLLTGLLLEAAHMKLFLLAQYPEEEILHGLELASDAFIKYGITSVHDAGGFGTEHFRYLYKAVESKKVKIRINVMYGSLHESQNVVQIGLEAGVVTGLGSDTFKIGPAKVFIDGSSSGPTAKTRLPYSSNTSDSGILYLNQEELNDSLEKAHQAGWQITAHAIGDRAVEMMINCIEKCIKLFPRKDCRHRIEHSAITPPDLIQRMKELNIIPILNPAFIYEFGDGYLKDYGDRVNYMFPFHSLLEQGITLAVGSDSPITDVNPMIGIHAAMTRVSKNGKEVGTNQKVPLEEVIKAYTIYGAYASFEDNIKGSLQEGKLADFVVLDSPLLSISPNDISRVKVDLTIINGEIVFERMK